MHTSLTPSRSAPPSGSNGVAASKSRADFRARRHLLPFRFVEHAEHKRRGRRPRLRRSSARRCRSFVGDHHVGRRAQIAALDVADAEPFTSASSGHAALRSASPLPGSSRLKAAATVPLSTPSRTHSMLAAPEVRPSTSHSGCGSTVRASHQSGTSGPAAERRQQHTIAGRCTPRIRPYPRSAAAIVAPVLPTAASTWARPSFNGTGRADHERGVLLGTAEAGSSSITITSDASTPQRRWGACRRQMGGDVVGAADKQHLRHRARPGAGNDLRGRAVATHLRVERDHRRHGCPRKWWRRPLRVQAGQSTSSTCRPQ